MQIQIRQDMPESGFLDIGCLLEKAVAGSGVACGVCVIRAVEPGVGLLHGPRDAQAGQDLWDDYARLFDGAFGPYVKAAVGGQALELIILDGRPLLGPAETVYAAGYGGGKSAKFSVGCFG